MKTLAIGWTFTVTFRPDHRLYLPSLTPDLAHSQCTAVSSESSNQEFRTFWPALFSHKSVFLTQAPPFEGLFSEVLYSGDSAKTSYGEEVEEPWRHFLSKLIYYSVLLNSESSSTLFPGPCTSPVSIKLQEPFAQGSLSSEMIHQSVLIHLTLSWCCSLEKMK